MSSQEEMLERVRSAFRLFCRAERTEGRRQLEAVWTELESGDHPYVRCVAAHYLADTEEDLHKALEWDLRALKVAQSIDTGKGQDAHPSAAAVRAFYPSLHLNLADDYRKLGEFDKARHHVDLGNEMSGALGLDAYGQSVRAGLVRVDAQIQDLDSGPPVVFDFD